MLRLTPTTSNFGSVVIGESSVTMAITVENIGEGPTGNISAAISGSSGSNFEIDSNGCNVLEADASCTIQVVFVPNSAGMKSAALAVTASPGGSVQTTLDGIGLRPGDLTIVPSTHAYGSVIVGNISTAQTFTVTNPGGVTSGTLTTTVGGSAPGEFTKTADTCNGQTLAPSATCIITVAFEPASSGPKSAAFTVSGMPGGDAVAAVSGVGLAPPQLFVNPPSQAFGSVVVNQTSAIATFNLVNIGGAPTTAISQVLSGADAGDFTVVSSSCMGAVLQPNSACAFSVRFQPLSTGGKGAQIDLSAALGGSVNVPLTGTGIAPGQLTIAPPNHAFANTIVGTQSATQQFVVTNTGGVPTGVLTSGLSGSGAAHFTITANTCSGTLAASATCTIDIAFIPGSTGAKSASVFVSGTPGGTVSAALSGNGFPAAALSITPSSRDFGSVGVNGMSGFLTFTVRNLGGTASGDPTITLGGANPTQFMTNDDCVGPLDPLETCTVSVRFQPTAIGNFSASVIATASPGGSASATVFGQGVSPASLSVNPSNLQFPLTLLGDVSNALTFVVTNNGGTATGPLTVGRAGPAAGDYNIVSTTCTTLAPQASCSVTISFQPTQRGTRNGSISVGGSPGGSVSVAVSGDALPRIEIIEVDFDAPVSPYDFDEVPIGSAQCARVVVLNNTPEDHPLGIANDFGIPEQFFIDDVDCFGFSKKKDLAQGKGGPFIFANDVCRIDYCFEPSSTGAKFGQSVLSIGSTAFDRVTQQFEGTGINGISMFPITQPPGFSDPTSSFGNVAVGATSPSLVFRVQNDFGGVNTGTIDTAALQVARFQIVEDGCDGEDLDPGAFCDIEVTFTPTLLGLDQTVLAVTSQFGGPASVDISGTGVDPSLLIFNPTPLDFGDVFAGTTQVLTLTVTNPAGAQTAGPLSFALQNDSCDNFGYGDPCFDIVFQSGDCQDGATVLTGGQSCTIHVQFTSNNGQVTGCGGKKCGGSSMFGPKSAEIVFNADPGTNGDFIVNLLANVVSTISIAPPSFDFGPVAAEDSPNTVFTVRNDSPGPVDISGFDFSGNETGLNVVASTCTTLVSTATCQVTVSFDPEGSVDLDASLDAYTNDGYGFAQASISGSRDLPSSCLEILTNDPTAGTGQYHIDVFDNGNGVLADCDMVTDGGGYTSVPITDSFFDTFRATDFNECQTFGMDVVVPRTFAHAQMLTTNYPSNFSFVPGVTGSDAVDLNGCPMNSNEQCATAVWSAIDGGPWFIRDIGFTEPNGDYTPGCWLGYSSFDANGFVFNDGLCTYGGDDYVCSTNDKGAPIPVP